MIKVADSIPVLELRNASKLYGGVAAIDKINFSLRHGEVHAILGENGAGKSTLTKALAGVVILTEGEIWVSGRQVAPASPREALSLGIAMVFQETSLVPSMSVAQNLYLGQEKFFNRLRGVYIAAQQFLQSLNFDIDPAANVSALGAAKKQMVEISRAVLHNVKVIIFDEPTATLTPEEKMYFFNLVGSLKARGVSIIFISHAIEEALSISDRITVLRDARHVVTGDTALFDRDSIIKAMIGRDLTNSFYGRRKSVIRKPLDRVLSIQNLRMSSSVKNNSLSVFAGQVTGVFGLVGAGRTETFKVVAGILKRDFMYGGEILVNGRPVRYLVPAEAVKDGIAYITEDRKIEGFFETMSVAGNIYMGRLAKAGALNILASSDEERQAGRTWTDRLKIKVASLQTKVVELSGGNQQKVVIAKSLIQNPQLIIFDEPTRGVDIGAIAEIHHIINGLADEGKAVVVISSYLPEILGISDRILVSRAGKVVEEFSAQEATEARIMYAAVH